MYKTSVKAVRIIAVLLSLILIASVFSLCAGAATDSFEKSISAFPESYRVKLRELHKKYPKWKFEILDTHLDWNDVIENETKDDLSLVEEYCTSYAFKSHAKGDYNQSTGKYIYKDGGFVTADETAVAYFLDPRNSLTVNNIFQFEKLTFSSSCSVETVESILYGSFMYDTKITYYDKNGKRQTEDITYGNAIYNAGKKYNVNPSFLASKILNEIGYSGSSSVSGKYSGYEGIYNFYNIGASDGTGAIARGLRWASSGTSYSRPWNKPSASIQGGAEFLAEQYIAQGQNTGYLQKFQVNPKAGYKLYDHQYMTNVSGAVSQGYSTFVSYSGCGVLGEAHSFIIPVFDNMPGEDTPSSTLNFTDTYCQDGKMNQTSVMRSGPSNVYAQTGVKVPQGAKVIVYKKVRTDSNQYLSVLGYPYWYYIGYTANGKTYKGYIYAGYIEEKSTTVLPVGKYTLTTFGDTAGHDDKLKLHSSNESVATVSGSTVTVKKAGKATITGYSPCGGFDTIIIECTSSAADKTVNSLKFSSSTTNTVSLKWKAAKSASGYQIVAMDDGGVIEGAYSTTSKSYKVKSLQKGEKYKMLVRSYTVSSSVKHYGAFSYVNAAAVPETVKDCVLKHEEGYIFSWKTVKNVDGYELSVFEDGIYLPVKITTDNYIRLNGDDEIFSNAYLYRVRSFVKASNNKTVYSAYSGSFSVDYTPEQVVNITQSDTTSSSYTLKWKECNGAAGYIITVLGENGKYSTVTDTENCIYTAMGLGAGESETYKIRSYTLNENNERVYAEYSREFTATTIPKRVGTVSYDITSSGVKLSWEAINSPGGYIVSKVNSDGTYDELYKITKPSVTIPTFKGKMKIAVCSFCESSFGDVCSKYTKTYTIGCKADKPTELKIKKVDNGFVFKWKSCTGVNGYSIEMLDEDMGVYVPLSTSSNNSVNLFGLKGGTFRIRSYMKLTGQTLYSSYAKVCV